MNNYEHLTLDQLENNIEKINKNLLNAYQTKSSGLEPLLQLLEELNREKTNRLSLSPPIENEKEEVQPINIIESDPSMVGVPFIPSERIYRIGDPKPKK